MSHAQPKMLKTPKLSLFLKEMTSNHLNNIEIYSDILLEYKSKVKEDVKEIKTVLVEVKDSLMKRLNKYLEFLHDFIRGSTKLLREEGQEVSYHSLLKNSTMMNEILKFVDFVNEELNCLKNLRESQSFVNLLDQTEKQVKTETLNSAISQVQLKKPRRNFPPRNITKDKIKSRANITAASNLNVSHVSNVSNLSNVSHISNVSNTSHKSTEIINHVNHLATSQITTNINNQQTNNQINPSNQISQSNHLNNKPNQNSNINQTTSSSHKDKSETSNLLNAASNSITNNQVSSLNNSFKGGSVSPFREKTVKQLTACQTNNINTNMNTNNTNTNINMNMSNNNLINSNSIPSTNLNLKSHKDKTNYNIEFFLNNKKRRESDSNYDTDNENERQENNLLSQNEDLNHSVPMSSRKNSNANFRKASEMTKDFDKFSSISGLTKPFRNRNIDLLAQYESVKKPSHEKSVMQMKSQNNSKSNSLINSRNNSNYRSRQLIASQNRRTFPEELVLRSSSSNSESESESESSSSRCKVQQKFSKYENFENSEKVKIATYQNINLNSDEENDDDEDLKPDIENIFEDNFESLIEKFKAFISLDKLGNYILSNLEECIRYKIVYKSEYSYNFPQNFSLDKEFVLNDPDFINLKKNFENVQLTILKKDSDNRHLSACVKLIEKYFKFFVRRKDETGNLMFKGVLSCDFVSFENYFSNAYKAFEPIETVQIDVFLFKYDLFLDYDESYDKTNLHRNEMRILLENAKVINALRKHYDQPASYES